MPLRACEIITYPSVEIIWQFLNYLNLSVTTGVFGFRDAQEERIEKKKEYLNVWAKSTVHFSIFIFLFG